MRPAQQRRSPSTPHGRDGAGLPGRNDRRSQDRVYGYELTDPDDHVAHAAIIGKADTIVTDDSRAGFATAPDLIEAQIEIVTVREFAANTIPAHPSAGLRALREMSAA